MTGKFVDGIVVGRAGLDIVPWDETRPGRRLIAGGSSHRDDVIASAIHFAAPQAGTFASRFSDEEGPRA
jgi:hypothetical protein